MGKKAGSARSESKKKPKPSRRGKAPAREPAERSITSLPNGLALPFEAELVPATEKRHDETVVFVHHFGGSKRSVLRHVRLVNDLGYDAVRFNLMFNSIHPGKRLPITGDFNFGYRHIWAEQIEGVLNAIPGKKILFTFSMPSNSALQALARRHAEDVSAWICDGGPFLQLPVCVWNLFNHVYEIKNPFKRGAYTGGALLLYGLGFPEEVAALIASLPARFPVLSIRGHRDPLVPSTAIDDVFRQRADLALEVLDLKTGHHLDGLKNHHDAYVDRVSRFLANR